MGGFLDRISGLLDKGLLLAAVFPLLTVGFIVAVGGATLLGWRASFYWLGSLSASSAATLTGILTILLLLVAFLLRSLRRPILLMWSGTGGPGWLLDRQEKRRNDLQQKVDTLLLWENAQAAVDAFQYEHRTINIPPAECKRLMRAITQMVKERRVVDARVLRGRYDQRCGEVSTAYGKYDGESLIPLRLSLLAFVEERRNDEKFQRQALRNRLALEFGPPGLIEGTRLGNILAALDNYPFRRYGMEGSVFWPHLEQMIKGDLLDDVQNQRILLDFVLALARLLVLLAAVTLVVGPWISFGITSTIVILTITIILAATSRAVYLAALPTANALSRGLRAGCDLYRRDLLGALGVFVPPTLDAERAEWQRLSRLVIYGDVRGGVRFRPWTPPAPGGHDT